MHSVELGPQASGHPISCATVANSNKTPPCFVTFVAGAWTLVLLRRRLAATPVRGNAQESWFYTSFVEAVLSNVIVASLKFFNPIKTLYNFLIGFVK